MWAFKLKDYEINPYVINWLSRMMKNIFANDVGEIENNTSQQYKFI